MNSAYAWRLLGVPTPSEVQPKPAEPQVSQLANQADLQHLDDLEEAITSAVARLNSAHTELLQATHERQQLYAGFRSGQDWQDAVDHEYYLIRRCAELKQRVTEATEKRNAFLAN